MDIHLTPELEQWDDLFGHSQDEIRRQIEEGWLSAEKGELVDGGEVFDRLEAELAPEFEA